MSNQAYKKELQRIGEDAAYTFKGLYKTSDSLGFIYNIFLIIPISFSILCLGFDKYLPSWLLKIASCFSLISAFILLLNKKNYSEDRIEKYRILANEFKDIYNDVEGYYYSFDESKPTTENIRNIKTKMKKLRIETAKLPINIIGRFISKKKIKEEMNLDWIYSEKE